MESISSEDSEHLPAPSSVAVMPLAIVAVSKDAAKTTVASTVAASNFSDETANSVEPIQVPTTMGAPLCFSPAVGLNPLAQLHRALLQLVESNPAFEVRPLSPTVHDSTKARLSLSPRSRVRGCVFFRLQ